MGLMIPFDGSIVSFDGVLMVCTMISFDGGSMVSFNGSLMVSFDGVSMVCTMISFDGGLMVCSMISFNGWMVCLMSV